MGRKFFVGAFIRGGAGSPSNTKSHPYQVASSSIWPNGRNRYGPKIGGLCPFGGGGAGSPSNTIWPEPRPVCCQVSSWSIQPFGHSAQTDRQRSHSIGWTVLKTVAQKLLCIPMWGHCDFYKCYLLIYCNNITSHLWWIANITACLISSESIICLLLKVHHKTRQN